MAKKKEFKMKDERTITMTLAAGTIIRVGDLATYLLTKDTEVCISPNKHVALTE